MFSSSLKAVLFNELKMALKDPLFFIPYFLIPGISMGGFWVYIHGQGLSGPEVYQSFKLMMLIIGTLASTLSLVLCADSFAGEKERNSLEILLCTPIGLKELFFGKLLGILPLPILIGWATQLVLWALCFQEIEYWFNFREFAVAMFLTPLSAVFLCSLSLFFSLRTQTARTAAQFSGLVAVIYLIVLQAAGLWLYNSISALVGWFISLMVLSLLAYGFSWRKFEKILY